MADFQLRFDVTNLPPERVQALAALTLDLRPFWPTLTNLFRGWMREQFQSEGAAGGDPWAPITGEYARWKARHYPGRSILVASGYMRNRATAPITEARPQELTLTIQDTRGDRPQGVAVFHQEGTARMPARRIIPDRLPAKWERELERAADEYAEDVLRRFFA